MSIATILQMLGMIEPLIEQLPTATAMFNAIKAMIASGAEPTTAQWASLVAMQSADHAALQA